MVATGKAEEEEKRRQRRLGSYNATQKLKEATTEPFLCQRDSKDGHDAPGTPKKVVGGVVSTVDTVHSNYKFAIRQNSKNYSQIFITTQKSPKTKAVQNQKFYNFASITIS